ncbi:unnamed protein product [Aphanomyces euteiches]|uniref:Uncharacterized protein n=1 Tax=Aphanomyces euteiches TaxID=100861 RepID=A0A6G0WY35_9STRA|nr:hypothetical protein Ae201684_010445 [Aphanomyces euteiches]KAH9089947.1 hypothetical protein Ae201684P_014702 [Aphanomyces euteiches]KAH9138590.1 hypothetical protein AeRB84_017101 [Aphanomyces euteiches]
MMSITIPSQVAVVGDDALPNFSISSLLNPIAFKKDRATFAKDLTGAYGLLDLRRDTQCFLSSCTREATIGGLCVEHTCKVQGCRSFSIMNDMCQFHSSGDDSNGGDALTTPRLKPVYLPSMHATSPVGKSLASAAAAVSSNNSKTYVRSRYCKITDCHKLRHKNGLCVAHGGGWYCKVDGCTKHSKAKGLCSAHGGIHYCRIDGCTKYRKKKGLCIAHGRGLFGRSDSICSSNE